MRITNNKDEINALIQNKKCPFGTKNEVFYNISLPKFLLRRRNYLANEIFKSK